MKIKYVGKQTMVINGTALEEGAYLDATAKECDRLTSQFPKWFIKGPAKEAKKGLKKMSGTDKTVPESIE